MMMNSGRVVGRRWRDQTLLPLRRSTRQLSSTVSCWYCDFKFFTINEPLLRFGRKHSRGLKAWFSVGTGFSLAAVLGVTVIMVCAFAQALLVYAGNGELGNSLSRLFPLFTGLNVSLSNMLYLCLSSVVCVLVHELGHALAAASEGVQIEYIAVFVAVLFPGALVAFDHASLQVLPRVGSLRIYCAGVWHNAAFCAVCALALFLLPFMLSPFYIHGEGPMVLDVPSSSPLSGYLSPHDVILSLDDVRVHTAEEWKQTIAALTDQNHSLTSGKSSAISLVEKGYCVPHSLLDERSRVRFESNQTYCSNDLIPFASVTCLNVSKYNDHGYKDDHQRKGENIYCLDAKDVIKLRKCVYSSTHAPQNGSGCLCSEAESCLTPVPLSGLGWIEITYSSLECHNNGRSLLSDEKNYINGEKSCHQMFVFVGDLISMAHSIHLTSYQPRWPFYFITYLPSLLEKFFTCAFHVSLVLALLNSLPVYFLDGESILEVTLHYFSSVSPRMRQSVLRCCLLLGTFISAFFMVQIICVSLM